MCFAIFRDYLMFFKKKEPLIGSFLSFVFYLFSFIFFMNNSLSKSLFTEVLLLLSSS